MLKRRQLSREGWSSVLLQWHLHTSLAQSAPRPMSGQWKHAQWKHAQWKQLMHSGSCTLAVASGIDTLAPVLTPSLVRKAGDPIVRPTVLPISLYLSGEHSTLCAMFL